MTIKCPASAPEFDAVFVCYNNRRFTRADLTAIDRS